MFTVHYYNLIPSSNHSIKRQTKTKRLKTKNKQTQTLKKQKQNPRCEINAPSISSKKTREEKRERERARKLFTGSLWILRAMVLANGSLILATSLGRNEGKPVEFPSEKTPPRPTPSHFAAIGVLVVSEGKPHLRVILLMGKKWEMEMNEEGSRRRRQGRNIRCVGT